MGKFLFTFLLLSSLNAQAVVYGVDDRREAYLEPQAIELRKATAIMVSPVFVKESTDTFDFLFPKLGSEESINVCKEQRFANDPSAYISCTGVLIAEDKILTAGHCALREGEIKNEKNAYCESFDWYFDFENTPNGKAQLLSIPKSKKYSCKKVIYAAHKYEEQADGRIVTERDFAIIQLDRPVEGRNPVKLGSKVENFTGSLVLSLGYPFGVPLKAVRATLKKDHGNYWGTDMDVSGGQSGSPVFNSNNELIGVVVRSFPEPDLIYDTRRKCSIANKCSNGQCLENESPAYSIQSEVQKILPFIDAALKQ